MHTHRFALLAAASLALALGTGSDASSAEILPDDIVFHDTNLVVDVSAPRLALSGKQFTIDVEVSETTGNGSEYTQVELDTGGSTLKSKLVSVPAGGSSTVTFPVTLSDDGSYTIEARLPDSEISAQAPIDVTQFRADVANVLLPSLVGYGGQFNHHLFFKPLNPIVPPGAPALEEKIETLEPQIVRIFFPPLALTQPERLASFIEVVELAQQSGAVINVTWQSNSSSIELNMSRFANVLADLVENRGVSNLRWVTLLNEPNSTLVPLPTYERMYRVLDGFLAAAGVREQIRFMGGDLVQDKQREWFQYMAANMADVLDAYSVHIFWDYWDTGKIAQRLEDVRKIVTEELPVSGRKPTYVMEYGVRGIRRPDGPAGPLVPEPGLWSDRTPMARTNISAFQMGWFNVFAARLGYPATSVWDTFNAKYDNGTQDYSCIGPAPDFELRPCYSLLRLFTATTEPGWRIVGLDGDSGGKLLTAYSGTGGLTVIGLDRAGGSLNDGSGGPGTYTVSGLPSLTTFKLVVWNRDGTGQLTSDQEIVTDALGIARLTVAQHAVWALTTHPVAD
jgi:hypothetical protein